MTFNQLKTLCRPIVCALCLAAVGPTAVCLGQDDPVTLTLVRNGKPAAAVVLDKQADKAARFAAFELTGHIRRMTGAELPVVGPDDPVEGVRILVGQSEATRRLGLRGLDFEPQQYLVQFRPGILVLLGRDKPDKASLRLDFQKDPRVIRTWPGVFDDQGTLYAAYDFLHTWCGIRWLNPTRQGTVVPNRSTLTVTGTSMKRRPFMDYRGGAAAIRTAERTQTRGGFWRDGTPEGKRYNELAFGSNDMAVVRAWGTLWQLRTKAGGENAKCNHSFNHYYERFWHKDHRHFEAHRPEYFAQGYEGKEPPQLCYSSEATLKQVVADARDYFDHGGYKRRMRNIGTPGYEWGKNFFALEPMDNAAFCKCATCVPQYEPDRPRNSMHSTYWFTFVNRVARELKKSHPDKKISTLAYMTHEGFPTDLELEDNVVVHFCISQNRTPYNTEALKVQMDLLEAWSRKQQTPMYVWLYHTFPREIADKSLFNCFPGFFADELDRQFKVFRKLDVRGIFHCGFSGGEVENYLSMRLMDDPTLKVDDLLNEYFAQFGEAARPLKRFYRLVEQRYCDPENYPMMPSGKRYGGHQTVAIAWNRLGTAAVMDELGKLMQQAVDVTRGKPEAERVDLWKLGVWDYMKAGREQYVERAKAPMPEVKAPRVSEAGGDVTKVAWDKAADLGDRWYRRGGGTPTRFALSGRICHDGTFVYMELVEKVDGTKLISSPQVAPFDDWEVMMSLQKALPFRQYMVGPDGKSQALSHGEVNWRSNVKAESYARPGFGMTLTSDVDDQAWVTRMAFPMKEMLDRPIAAGSTFYLNVVRVRNPALAREPRFGIDTWVSYTSVKTTDRMGTITLEK